jgi:uncharacterized membrane protein YeaQ/YmgE (transglycosylase-associated protein family)
MPRPRMQMRVIDTLFLRFYAANLSRSRRNDPPTACADAILQMGAVGGCVSTTVYMAVGALLAPPLLAHLHAEDWIYLVIAAGAGGAVGLWAWWRFRGYRNDPAAAAPYGSRASVRMINILYIVVPIAWAWALGLASRFLGHI